MKPWFALLSLVLSSRSIDAQILSPPLQLELHSQVLGQDRMVFVSLPATYSEGADHYSVLYLTDGSLNFAHTVTSAQFLARNGLMPDVIVVGIPDPDRVSDLYDTRADFKAGNRIIPLPTSGNGDRFLAFIERELIPWVEHNYRTSGLRILLGQSAGGYFALHAMRTKPGLFQAVIAASPWLAWDDARERKALEPFLASPDAGVRTLFLSYANEPEDWEMQANVDSVVAILKTRSDSSLRWTLRTYPDETHETTSLRAYYDGLRMVFAGYDVPRNPATGRLVGSLADLETHFVQLSKQLGATVSLPKGLVNELGYDYLQAGNQDSALAVFRFNIEQHPEWANGWDSYGEGLAKSGKTSEALASYRKAVEVAKHERDPGLAVFQNHLARLSDAQGRQSP